MLRVVLEHLLLGPSGLTSVGLPLLIDGVHRMLFGRLPIYFPMGTATAKHLTGREQTGSNHASSTSTC